MDPRLCAIGLGLAAVMIAGCAREERQAVTLEPGGSSTSISSSTDPATASGEPPEVTASSAAAAAPECDELNEADRDACRPEATGDPQAR